MDIWLPNLVLVVVVVATGLLKLVLVEDFNLLIINNLHFKFELLAIW